MATLDDKLMGEKLHYYCDSSDDEGEADADAQPDGQNDGGRQDDVRGGKGAAAAMAPKFVPEAELQQRESTSGRSANTGPKGVMEDWRRFKQLERENREEAAAEQAKLAKKLAMTCRTDKEDERAKLKEQQVEDDLENLLDDDYLREFMERRMREMMSTAAAAKTFGRLTDLVGGEDFLDALDKEDKTVTVVIFIFEEGASGCESMRKALVALAKDYPRTKFCRVRASGLPKLSRNFKLSGVPALLVYRGGELVTNFVGLNQTLGDDFYASDVESLLVEHAVIVDKELVPSIVRGPAKNATVDDSDSD